jgi:uncharacterized protein
MAFWNIFGPRRKSDFYALLLRQAERTYAGCEALVDFLDGKIGAEEVGHLEEVADDARRVLIDELNHTFITPIDREDIFALSRAIDDVVDHAKNTVQEMQTFEVGSNGRLREMSALLKEGAKELLGAIRHLKRNPNVAVDYAVRAKRLENAMNKEYLAALKELFSTQDIRLIFSLREIYRHLNRSADRVDDAANIISDIVMKTT